MADSPSGTRLSPERATPEEMSGRLMESEHRGRYLWAAQLAGGGSVLDAGCGTGYGTEILSAAGAASAVGVDVAEEAVSYARANFGEACEFVQADLMALPFADDSFDLVACFEVIEHVEDQPAVIRELRRVLRPDGVLAISSPNRGKYPPGNPFHTHEYVPDELREELKRSFTHVTLYRQAPWLTAAVMDDAESAALGPESELTLATIKLAALSAGEEVFTVALAGDEPPPEAASLAVMGQPFEVGWWERQVEEAKAELAESNRQRERWGANLLAAESQLAAARNELEQRRAAMAELKQWAEQREAAHRDELRESEDRLLRCDQERQDFESRLRRAEGTIDDVTGSLSWRITGPLRALKRLLSG
jgi:ubiquinone/menaquinone biosynthesis C-methylase UbiE